MASIFNTLDTQYGDYKALFALCCLYAVGDNEGMYCILCGIQTAQR